MVREGWFLVLGRWRGAPVRVHLLAPLFALLVPGRSISLGTVTGFLLLVLAHEFGHALLVRAVGASVYRIDLLPWGGECEHSQTGSELKDSIIAWGGVLAQAALMIPAERMLPFAPGTGFMGDFLWSLTAANFMLAAFNLIPVPPLDGSKAWRLLGLGPMWAFNRLQKWRRRRLLRVVPPPAPPRKDWLN